MAHTDNTGRMMSKRVTAKDGTSLCLQYARPEALSLRALVQSIRLKGDKTPSMALIARRALHRYVHYMETAQATRPDAWAAEVIALEGMVTHTPAPARHSKRVP